MLSLVYQEFLGETDNIGNEHNFRTMDLERPISGKAYIGRIKAVDNFGAEDLLYGIVYKGSQDKVDFNLFKSVCSTHNNMFFYAKSINKGSTTFTMRNCLNTVENYPMVGSRGISMLNFPMTFYEFGKLAYEINVLSSSKGFDLLCQGKEGAQDDTVVDEREVTLPPPVSAASRVRSVITKKMEVTEMIKKAHDNAKKLSALQAPDSLTQGERFLLGNHGSLQDKHVFAPNEIPATSEEVIEEVNGSLTNITTDAWRERCLIAERKADSFESVIKDQEAQIAALKAEVVSATQSSEKFMTAAALADAQRREYRSDNASEVVDGLRPEFDILKGISKHLSSVTKSVDKGNTESVELHTEVLRILEDVQQRFSNLDHNVKTNTEQIAHIRNTLDVFGLSHAATPFNIPDALSNIVSRMNPKQLTDRYCQTSGFGHVDTFGVQNKVFNDYSDSVISTMDKQTENTLVRSGVGLADKAVPTEVTTYNSTVQGGNQDPVDTRSSLGTSGTRVNDNSGNARRPQILDHVTGGHDGRYVAGTGSDSAHVYREQACHGGITPPTFPFNIRGDPNQHQIKALFTKPPPPILGNSQGRISYPPPPLDNNNRKTPSVWIQEPNCMKRNNQHEDENSTRMNRQRRI